MSVEGRTLKLKEKETPMRTNVDVYEEADATSSRSEEQRELNDPSRISQDGSTGSQRSRNTDQQQAELFRKLDSIKGHLLRAGNSNDKPDQPPLPMGFHGHHVPSYYNPYPYGVYPSTSHVPPPPYRDPYGNWYPPHPTYPPQMLPRPTYPPGQYVDIGPDILDPQLQDPRFFPATPTRYGDVPPYNSPVLPHSDNAGQFSPHHGTAQAHHKRWSSEIDSEMGGAFARGHVQNAVSDNDCRRCHPLVGGAPFIACHNCFELLYLPKKKLLVQENQQKLQCGACSEFFSFSVVDKKLVFSSSETTNRLDLEVEEDTSTVVDDVPLKNEEPNQEDKIVQPSEHSDDESISSEPQQQVSKSVRNKPKDTKASSPPPPPINANLLQLFENSNLNRAAFAYGMAQIGYNKQKSYAKQDSVASETDISYNEYYNNSETSEDSRISKTRKEERSRRNRKEGSDYSFSEMPNKSISEEQEMEQYEVWVNGHLIPEELVISAEKQAGPVQAGKYWYDYRAGFWGVMGNPCLGIIPPFIEEFSRPMPDKCGAGNTGVFVNGRELHERDLELLAGRGLPRGKNRSYIVDISGRVLDGDSGEELKGLGKLAPTIEKVKHGFGMRVPKSLASSA